MEEYKTLGIASLAITFFLFTGCIGNTEESVKRSSVQPIEPTTSVQLVKKVSTSTKSVKLQKEEPEIILSGKALGDGKIFFSWELTGGAQTKEKYRIIRSENKNPEFNRKNYWVQVDKAFSNFTWTALTPSSTKHFRLCIFNQLKEECELYSNNVELTIQ